MMPSTQVIDFLEQNAIIDPVYSFLEHHGVKGMHWGVRKKRANGVSITGRKLEDHSRLEDMSDSELRSKLNRMSMEKQYTQMTSKESAIEKAAKNGAKFFGSIATNEIRNATASEIRPYAEKGVKYIANILADSAKVAEGALS